MRYTPSRIALGISASACILLALMLLILPLQWIFAALAAAGIHEMFHILAVYLCGGCVRKCQIGTSGAVLEAEAMTQGRELVCVLAGPVGGLLPLLFVRWFPRVAICAVFHSAYNLLPIGSLDGGVAVRRVTEMIWPAKATIICHWFEWVTMVLLWGAAVYCALWLRLGMVPIAMVLVLQIKIKWKNPLQSGP